MTFISALQNSVVLFMLLQHRRDFASTGGSHKMRMKQDTAYLHTEATNIFIFVRYPREHHVWTT